MLDYLHRASREVEHAALADVPGRSWRSLAPCGRTARPWPPSWRRRRYWPTWPALGRSGVCVIFGFSTACAREYPRPDA